jgi:NADPH:quinone reductase-like Zn-dependent oxidoreductase
LLLQAGGGGVGHLAIQIAKALGFYVITTASASKKDFVKECGADQFINYKEQVFQDVIEKPVDAVFDLIGGDYIDKSLKVLKKGGTIVSIPSSGNAEVKEKAERAGCQGVRFRVQTNQNDLMELVKLFNKPGANIFVGEQFDWGQVDRAFSILENGHVKGKIVLSTGKD